MISGFPQFSVLMSLYKSECAAWYEQALDSIAKQTVLPSEIVVVHDGPVTEAHMNVEREFDLNNRNLLRIVGYENNRGLGFALRFGLERCAYSLVARMDTDDIARPERFELQLNYLLQHPEVSVVGGWIREFSGRSPSEGNYNRERRTPLGHIEIAKAMRSRNPFNHMTVMLRRNSVIERGSYQNALYFEDYYLWVRLAISGAKFANIPFILVDARIGSEFLKRRHGLNYAILEARFLSRLRRLGFIPTAEYLLIASARFVMRLVPLFVLEALYDLVLRRMDSSDVAL